MSILVLAIEKPFWQDVLLRLTEQGLKITHAVVHYRYSHEPNHFFDAYKLQQIDGKLFYRTEDIAKILPPTYSPLSGAELLAFTPIERDFYILTDRFCYFPKSFRYRKRLFRENLRYWLNFYRSNKTKAVLISCTPHNLSDYMAYHVAKYLRIPVLQLAHTMINDFVLIRHDYREEEKVPPQFLADAEAEKIKALIPETLLRHAFTESAVLKMVVQKNDASVGAKNVSAAKNKINLQRLRNRLWRMIFSPVKFKGALALNGVYLSSVRRVVNLFDIFRQKREWEFHNKIAVTPDLQQKYIYFAMHMQPERTSTPEAELFEDHLLAIEILAKTLPPEWKLFVKENPRQFDKKVNVLKGRHFRDRTDYNDILRLPNVEIISQRIPTKDLIANAQIVSTLSGSIGWEALRAGKPVIIFANAWYAACRSVFKISGIAEAKSAISECQRITPQAVELDILRYLAYMKDKFCIGNMGDGAYIKAATLPYEQHVKSLADRIMQEFSK